MNPVLIGVSIYVGGQLLAGLLVSRRITTESEYLLAGRRLGYGLATFSIFATWFGAETCVGSAGAIYREGLSGGSADPFGYAACLLVMGLIFAAPLRRRQLTTLADLFRVRYSRGVERLAVLIMVPGSLIWAAAQIRAFGQVLAVLSDLETTLTITAAAAVAIVYTSFGGLFADALTDLIQGIALIFGLVVLLFAVTADAGGFAAAWRAVPPERLRPFGGEESTFLDTLEAWAIPICGSVLAQELISRVLATRSAAVARRACLLGGSVYLATALIPAFLGLVAAQQLPGLAEPEAVLPQLAERHLSTLQYSLFAGAIISAILSTVDSVLLVSASLVAHNVVIPLRPGLSEAAKVRVNRIGVILAGILAYVLALHGEGIRALVEAASAFGGAGIFVLGVFALFTRIGGRWSAAGALVTAALVHTVGTHVLGARQPYLTSLATATAVYLAVAVVEKARRGQESHNAGDETLCEP